ncbi:MAG: metallophosphoesterase [Pyrinomonadaceae bacterium]
MKPVPLEKALLATRESMAVKRELAHLLTAQVTDQKSVITYETDLGTFKLGTEFTFHVDDVLGETVLHFEDLNITLKKGDPAVRITANVPNSGENAITLVTTCNEDKQWHVKFTVDARGVGRIIEHDGGDRVESEPSQRVFIWRFRTVAQLPMVGWYDPPLLLQTESEVIVSTLFGGHSDYRLLEALSADANPIHDFTGYYAEDIDGQYLTDEKGHYVKDEIRKPREEIWIDYVGDTGDGWNSTYGVAYYLVQPKLSVSVAGGNLFQTERGNVLIFGGDQVYPTASRKQYKQRLVEPYRTALRYSEPPSPEVFAIPGNHDWYDSLVSFTRLFCSRRWFNGWRAAQRRSYFALKLPHKWWLLGLDVQLNSDIDHAQIEYFEGVAREMEEGDQIILCTAEPHWLQARAFERYGPEYNESNLAFLENNVLGKRVSLFLAGDFHYYRRHESNDGTQKIVAGGGGAFLSPTHAEDFGELRGGFKLKATFPDEATSRRLTWRNLFFLYYNPRFGFLTAILYFLTSWEVMADIGHYGLHDIGLAFGTTARLALIHAGSVFWILLMLAGFVAFTYTKSKLYQWIAGTLHGCVHLLAAFIIGWSATYFTVSVLGLSFQSPLQLLIAAIIIFTGGWVVGSLLVGVFLLVSLNVFGCLQNSAYSSLRIEDWKHFLRIKIESNGNLTIFPIGIHRVPRDWKRRPIGGTGPELVPDDPRATSPELIEPPIVLKH